MLSEVGHSLGLEIKPFVNLLLPCQPLFDITCFIKQVENNTIFDGFIELIGVNVGSKDLDALSLILL